jgi:tripartite-type tricarboxylate transporter receptor subunit TctC
LQQPEIRGRLERQGVEPAGSTPAEFAAFLKQQLADWGKAAREAGLKPE